MPGRKLANDYVVLKPKHSGFYSTPLDTLLTYLGPRRLILTGLNDGTPSPVHGE